MMVSMQAILLLPLMAATAASIKLCSQEYNATFDDLTAPPIDDANLIPVPSPYLGLDYADFSLINTDPLDTDGLPNNGLYYTASSLAPQASITVTAAEFPKVINFEHFDTMGCTVRDGGGVNPVAVPASCTVTATGVYPDGSQVSSACYVGATEGPITCEAGFPGVETVIFSISGITTNVLGVATPVSGELAVYRADNLVYQLCTTL